MSWEGWVLRWAQQHLIFSSDLGWMRIASHLVSGHPVSIMEGGGGGQPRGDEELLKVTMLLLSYAVYRVHSYPAYCASWLSAGEGSMRGLVRWEATLRSWVVSRQMRQVGCALAKSGSEWPHMRVEPRILEVISFKICMSLVPSQQVSDFRDTRTNGSPLSVETIGEHLPT